MKKILFGIALAALSGCANLIGHIDTYTRERELCPYYGTCSDADAIACAFREPTGCEGVANNALATILLPVTLVDFPFEVVFDTITLPYDIFHERTEQ